jgi:hypothetical protein
MVRHVDPEVTVPKEGAIIATAPWRWEHGAPCRAAREAVGRKEAERANTGKRLYSVSTGGKGQDGINRPKIG